VPNADIEALRAKVDLSARICCQFLFAPDAVSLSITSPIVKLAGLVRGGKSLKLSMYFATAACAGTIMNARAGAELNKMFVGERCRVRSSGPLARFGAKWVRAPVKKTRTQLLQSSEMSRWARTGLAQPTQLVFTLAREQRQTQQRARPSIVWNLR
jgi:hypothetical protein